MLIEQAQSGKGDAFGLLYVRYYDTVFRYIDFRVRNRQLAEDLTEDTFERALKRIGSFTWQGRDFSAWLVTIARNLVADHYKSAHYRLEIASGIVDVDLPDLNLEGDPETAVINHIINHATNVNLLEAVEQLTPKQQDCIAWRFQHRLSVAETAQAMGMNVSAVKALQSRAIRTLARLMPDSLEP